MNIKKKDILKIQKATEAEIEKLKLEYQIVAKSFNWTSNTVFMVLCIIGFALLFYSQNRFIDFVGFILFVYAFYTLSNRFGHKEGYIDGYYEASHQKDGAAPGTPRTETADEM